MHAEKRKIINPLHKTTIKGMKIEITKKEAILLESLLGEMWNTLDYENCSDKEFERYYGLTKDEALNLKSSIIRKLYISELNKHSK